MRLWGGRRWRCRRRIEGEGGGDEKVVVHVYMTLLMSGCKRRGDEN